MLQVRRWLDVVPVRRSRRSFSEAPVVEGELDVLAALCAEFRPFGDVARTVLVRQAPQRLFMGVAGSYGGISGAPSALAFVGRKEAPNVEAAVGYTGEAVVLEATALGLDTCWVGGMFSPRHAAALGGIAPGERVYAVSPLGHTIERVSTKERIIFGMGKPKFRREHEQIAEGVATWPEWARAGVEAARVAPSAMNRQPWRFRMDGDTVIIATDGTDTVKVSKRLDCGIAMLHFELAVLAAGAQGAWEFCDAPDVARWTPAG
ncbi:MAG: nitroreductase [Coriobacteriia bacterium]|nr:nitroreductase [Coriobacteriia bacterium]MBN2822169.1 nitroreductase [Coriobacteriia bacterium]